MLESRKNGAPSFDSKDDAWATTYKAYGSGNTSLDCLFSLHMNDDIDVEVSEVDHAAPGKITSRTYTTVADLLSYFQEPVPILKGIRAITIRKLSTELIKLLGTYFGMDHELWTVRLFASDREYFATPLTERGSQHFSHFHLACVDFFRATEKTPAEYKRSRKINHTTRLVRLIDSRPRSLRSEDEQPQIYVIRRLSGHLRKDGDLWSFLYLCDDFLGFENAHYIRETPGMALSHLPDWIVQCLQNGMSEQYGGKICNDGFGLITKILRDIKSSWKLMLTALENFLEDMNDNFNDQEFIDAASFLHREYLLSIDYFQRQLFYHERYVNYLTSEPSQPEIVIQPSTFGQDFVQEGDALKVLTLRLNALRQRTTTVLDNILNLNSIEQSKIATRQTQIQLQDTKIALKQGESIRKLTLVNMAFLPPSFVAAVFGMNTPQTEGRQIWIFVVFALVLFILTMTTALLRFEKVSGKERDTNTAPVLKWMGSLKISLAREDPALPFTENGKKID